MGSATLESQVEDKRRVVKGTLTAREYEVLALAAEGDSNQEIAGKLHVAVSTVQTYLKRIFNRLEARNRAHCIHLAHECGLFGGAGEPETDPVPPLTRTGQPLTRSADGPVFKKVGMVHRAVPTASKPSPRPCPPTHVLRVEHPTDAKETWEVCISVKDDLEARRRMTQLAGWVFPPRRVTLHPAGQMERSLGGLLGFRLDLPGDDEPAPA